MEQRQHTLLHRRLEVDEEISAGHQVDTREGRILDDVVLREDDHLPDLGHDLVDAPREVEIALQSLARDVRHRLLVVLGPCSSLERSRVHVGGEDLHLTRAEVDHEVLQDDAQRIGLLARRASGDPDPQRPLALRSFEDGAQDVVLDRVERLAIAEKARHADE